MDNIVKTFEIINSDKIRLNEYSFNKFVNNKINKLNYHNYSTEDIIMIYNEKKNTKYTKYMKSNIYFE